jgi:hypothetical protein
LTNKERDHQANQSASEIKRASVSDSEYRRVYYPTHWATRRASSAQKLSARAEHRVPRSYLRVVYGGPKIQAFFLMGVRLNSSFSISLFLCVSVLFCKYLSIEI